MMLQLIPQAIHFKIGCDLKLIRSVNLVHHVARTVAKQAVGIQLKGLKIQGTTPVPPPDMFKLVYYVAQTVAKRKVGIRLKCLLLALK